MTPSPDARLDVVIPAYNEADIIEASIAEIRKALASFPIPYQLIVADNGSTDSTAERAQHAGAVVLAVPTRGKGAALAHAARTSRAGYFAFIDADISAHPRELGNLYTVLQERHADVVIGSRLMQERGVHRSLLRTLTSRSFNLLRRLVLGISVADTQCGLKLMKAQGRNVLAECLETGWFLDMEFLARAERGGLSIVEVPVAWEEFRFAGRASKLDLVRDGVGAIGAMLRIRSRLS